MSIFRKLFGVKPEGSPEPAAPALPRPAPAADLSRAGTLVDCSGVDWNESGQLAFLDDVIRRHCDADLVAALDMEPFQGNPACSLIDGAILYSMAAHFQPGRIMEIGCGYTTWVLRRAKDREMLPGELIAIDPDPDIDITEYIDAYLAQPVRELPVSDFTILQEGEMVFVDSDHIYAPGGDVSYLFEEILPALPSGIIVGFHGIRLPREYSRGELERNFNEQHELLKALRSERAGELLLAGGWLAEHHRKRLDETLPPALKGQTPSAFWFRVK